MKDAIRGVLMVLCGGAIASSALAEAAEYVLQTGGGEAPARKAVAQQGQRKKAKRDARQAKDRLWLYDKGKRTYWWKDRHEAKLAEIKASGGKYDLVFLGDSISHRWDREGYGLNVLNRLMKEYSVLDIGFGADHTENVLWRITEGGELDGYEAKVVSLMIGTNNSLGYSARNVAAGIKNIVAAIREKQPKAKIILTAILPRYGASEEKLKMRKCNSAVNEIIRGYADGETVFWLDMTDKFPPLDGDYKAICPDSTHPNEKGYEIWAAELKPYLDRFVGKGTPLPAKPAVEKPLALDANDDSRPAQADARTFAARRIFPIDPELSNVDPATGSLTFYVPDQLAGQAWTLVAAMDGREVRQPLGADRKATVSFGAIPEGKYALKVRLLDAADGRELLANDYPVRVRARPTMPSTVKRLNNFVWELGEFPVKGGKVSFDNPRDGWVFLRSGTYETMRYFPCGPCTFKVPGRKCLVRLVKELDKGGVELSEVGSPFRNFTLDFYRKWIFGSFNTYSGPLFPEASDTTSTVARAYRELRERGAHVYQGARMRVGDHALFGDVGKMLALMESVGGRGRRDALGVDEMRMDLKGVNNRNLGDACWRYLEKHGYEEPIYACWCNVIDNEMTLPEEVAPSLSAVVHSGNGRGFILPEHYLCARNNRGSAEREIDMVVRFSQSLRRLMPTAPSHVSYLFGTYLIPGDWNSWCSPDPDMKAYFVMFMRRLATDPEFADVGGASFSRYYCDEELARFSAALVRYYCIEGRTDDLNEKLGYRYFPGYVNNGDFEKGFKGWTAEAAADGSLSVSSHENYGRRFQHRIGGGKSGDTFALFVRDAGHPNRLRRRVTGLKPGKKYALSFVTADYDDVLKSGTRPTNTVFHATLSNVEPVPEKSYVSVWPPEYFSPGGKRQTRTVTLGHKIVFKALGTETEIVFSDWKDEKEPGDRIGERRLLNNVGFYPYFDEDTVIE